jgi:hypothetical protein
MDTEIPRRIDLNTTTHALQIVIGGFFFNLRENYVVLFAPTLLSSVDCLAYVIVVSLFTPHSSLLNHHQKSRP